MSSPRSKPPDRDANGSPADGLSEDEYEAIEAAVMETARGRWFLAEHARRNRHAETELLLAVLEEIRTAVQTTRTPPVGWRVPAAFMSTLRAAVSTNIGGALPDPPKSHAEATLVPAVPLLLDDESDIFTFRLPERAA